MAADGHYGARLLYAEFAADNAKPFVELTSRIQTQNRSQDWSKKGVAAESAQSLAQLASRVTVSPGGVAGQTLRTSGSAAAQSVTAEQTTRAARGDRISGD